MDNFYHHTHHLQITEATQIYREYFINQDTIYNVTV